MDRNQKNDGCLLNNRITELRNELAQLSLQSSGFFEKSYFIDLFCVLHFRLKAQVFCET